MPKTVKQLRDELANYRDDTLVIMSRDPEGNGFEDFDGVSTERILDGEIRDGDELDEDEMEESESVLILWPGGRRYE